jgi:hypothetical protein
MRWKNQSMTETNTKSQYKGRPFFVAFRESDRSFRIDTPEGYFTLDKKTTPRSAQLQADYLKQKHERSTQRGEGNQPQSLQDE